ncbi:serine hydrolase domain-containing protein [Pseudoduganella violacea]|uniref:CubicO group peptidase (Beta-lactamase class C family) n=1 Tax=Pseudoduganella violacea TaxID=1715466 RepID=A0A7W5B831_9BURK|nr:serine hydrolase domain-containing protein [Pseudoduganella violacea]MBB3118254.1 CubicO group peptidase (beta-lactamase class C family) [Pseudoduganella violacea]
MSQPCGALCAILLAAFCFNAHAAPAAAANPAGIVASATAVARIDSYLTQNFAADQPGITVIAVKNGLPVLHKAYGLANLEQKTPLAPAMSLRVGSVTKQFTAAAIMLLAEQGKLKVGDSITSHLQDYPEQGKTITIEHLLTHTSGIPNYTALPGFGEIVQKTMSVNEMIAFFKDKPLQFAPGERFSYSNSGYFLLGAIIEKVSGQKYADYMRQHIFAPLQLNSTFYDSDECRAQPCVAGYSKRSWGGFEGTQVISMTLPYAAGALRSSVDDLARWNAAIVEGKLLKPETWRRMRTAYTLNNGKAANYGYGWFVGTFKDQPMYEHGGDIPGFSARTQYLPESGIYVAVITNRDGGQPDMKTVTQKISTLLLD